MKVKITICAALCGSYLALMTSTTNAQILYSESFDDHNAVNRWTAHLGVGFNAAATAPKPIDTNFNREPLFPEVDNLNDTFTGFNYDYSTVGIPSAPNSTGGSTTGLKLQANLFSAALGGFSVSPNGLDIRNLSATGNYVVKFDHWANTVGPMPIGGSGSTNLSTFGIMTAGTASQSLLSSDGVFFGYTGDGESSADFRAYSVEDKDSYDGSVGAPHGVYHAGTRNIPGGTAGPPVTPGAGQALYNQAFGTGRTVPASQTALFPGQTGTLNSGAAGFQWNANEIRKIGDFVEWWANGVKLITVGPLSQFSTPTLGGNLSFGHLDINATSSTDGNAEALLFSLVDNIVVEQLPAIVAEDADFDADGDVDGRDFLTWQRGFGTPDAILADGDADDDNDVDGDDLIIWQDQYGEPAGPLVASTSVPEPASVTLFGALLAMLGLRRPAFGFARTK
jgi:hypothetical protein